MCHCLYPTPTQAARLLVAAVVCLYAGACARSVPQLATWRVNLRPPIVAVGVGGTNVIAVSGAAAGSGAGFDVYAFDAADGGSRWHTQLADGPTVTGGRSMIFPTGPVVGGRRALIGDSYGDQWVLDVETGHLLWQVGPFAPPPSGRRAAPGAFSSNKVAATEAEPYLARPLGVIAGDKVVVCGPQLITLECHDAASGRVLWARRLPEQCGGIAADDTLVFVSSQRGSVTAYTLVGGRERWVASTPGQCWQVLTGPPRTVIAAGSVVTEIETTTGKVLWSAQLAMRAGLMDAIVYDHDLGRIYLVTADGACRCLDGANGRELWRVGLTDRKGEVPWRTSNLAIGKDIFLVANYLHGVPDRLLRLSSDGQRRRDLRGLAVTPLPRASSVAHCGDCVYVTDMVTGLLCLRADASQ